MPERRLAQDWRITSGTAKRGCLPPCEHAWLALVVPSALSSSRTPPHPPGPGASDRRAGAAYRLPRPALALSRLQLSSQRRKRH